MTPLVLLALAGGADPDPAQPYTAKRSDPVTYRVEFKAILTAPQGTRLLRVWVPVPPDDRGQEVRDSAWDTFPADVKPAFHTEPVFGNRFAYFEFPDPKGAQVVTHTFRATVWQLDWDVDPAKAERPAAWPESFAPYRRSEVGIRVDDRFKKLAGDLAAGARGPAGELAAVMDWADRNLTYDHSNTSLVASADHAFTKRRGDCSDYHGLCASLGRALGTPTRVTYGLHLFPKNLPCHCKLEAYLPPHGWVSFDVSETQRLVKAVEADPKLAVAEKAALAAAARDRLRRGFRDNTWLLHSKGTDYELAPKASGRVPLVPTLYAEADGKPLPLPDPADPTKREFAWMTAHRYAADRAVPYPFVDWRTLKPGR
ncbi:MAG: transglutaminase [Isosphaera sp.]|nr:transglutaminase [Isosphaera sp.]